jgi:hypothetical protein
MSAQKLCLPVSFTFLINNVVLNDSRKKPVQKVPVQKHVNQALELLTFVPVMLTSSIIEGFVMLQIAMPRPDTEESGFDNTK